MTERYPSPTVAHVLPFAAWIALLYFLDVPQLEPSTQYALRAGLGLALFGYARPWRWYSGLRLKNFLPALLLGAGVFAVWVVPESPWAPGWFSDFYIKWGVRPFGELREPLKETPYAPEVCGWNLTLVRALGSGLLIPFIEEFFWRGFLQRWIMGGDFWKHDAAVIDGLRFVAVAAVFGAEHQEWLAGIAAGLAYGWFYLRTRDIWAAGLAHAVTNLLLAAYVIRMGAWHFW